jgi:hypothetical protein
MAIAVDDPALLALQRAPLGEPFTPEQRAELDQDVADIAAGRVKLVPLRERCWSGSRRVSRKDR